MWITVWFAGFSTLEKRNKHTKKNCAPSWLYLQDGSGKCSAKCWTQPDRFIFWNVTLMWWHNCFNTCLIWEHLCLTSPPTRHCNRSQFYTLFTEFFGDRVIIIIGLWLPYSPVLDQCYVCLWGMLRARVYSVNPVTWDDLKESIQYILF